MEHLTGEQTVGVIAIAVGAGGGLLVGAVAIICYYWQVVRVAEQNAVLKKTMIDRGYTADDIERVVMAGDPQQVTHKYLDKVL